jgi:(p)ppGpp synthase/HD superfamily hydrolase
MQIRRLQRSGVWEPFEPRKISLVPTAELKEVCPSFVKRLPITAAALQFALDRHAGQVRDGDHAPFVLHPLEVGSLLSLAGYADHVVAAGVLHDVLEDTDTPDAELEERFGPDVSALVRAVSEDPSIEDEQLRKAALRSQVASSPVEAGAVFAADKVSKARELRLKLSCGLGEQETAEKLRHYRASLAMLERLLGYRHPILEQLRFELETLDTLPPA